MARVEMNAVVIDHGGHGPRRTIASPVAPAVVPAADELDGGIRALHDQGEGAGLIDVVLGAEAADLPAAVHLRCRAPSSETR